MGVPFGPNNSFSDLDSSVRLRNVSATLATTRKLPGNPPRLLRSSDRPLRVSQTAAAILVGRLPISLGPKLWADRKKGGFSTSPHTRFFGRPLRVTGVLCEHRFSLCAEQGEKLRACDDLRHSLTNLACVVLTPAKFPAWGHIAEISRLLNKDSRDWGFPKADREASYKQPPLMITVLEWQSLLCDAPPMVGVTAFQSYRDVWRHLRCPSI